MHVWQNIRGVKNTDQLNTRSILNIREIIIRVP